VGFGGPAPCGALRLDVPGEQPAGANRFAFHRAPDGDFVLYRITESGGEQLLKFDDRPCENVDFVSPNFYLSQSRQSGFKKMRMINLSRPDGSVAINNNMLRIHKDGMLEEQLLDTDDKLRGALREHFGICVDFPLKEVMRA
jgi:N-hydroxyarylamine O-acetyltransferase